MLLSRPKDLSNAKNQFLLKSLNIPGDFGVVNFKNQLSFIFEIFILFCKKKAFITELRRITSEP